MPGDAGRCQAMRCSSQGECRDRPTSPAIACFRPLLTTTFTWLSLVTACTAAGLRPHLRPLPGATVDTVRSEPEPVIERLTTEVRTLGFRVRASNALEGYLETEWHDLRSSKPTSGDHQASDRVIKVRAWADPLPPGETIVVLEAVYRRFTDPSQPSRELEVVVPPDHPADSLVQRLLRGLERP